jgi:transketolase
LDRFGASAPGPALAAHFGFTPEDVVAKVMKHFNFPPEKV